MTTDLTLEKKEKVLNLFQNIFTEDAVKVSIKAYRELSSKFYSSNTGTIIL